MRTSLNDVELLRDTLGAAEAGEVGNEDVDVDGNGNGDGDAIIRAGEAGPDIGLLCVTELLPLRLDRRWSWVALFFRFHRGNMMVFRGVNLRPGPIFLRQACVLNHRDIAFKKAVNES